MKKKSFIIIFISICLITLMFFYHKDKKVEFYVANYSQIDTTHFEVYINDSLIINSNIIATDKRPNYSIFTFHYPKDIYSVKFKLPDINISFDTTLNLNSDKYVLVSFIHKRELNAKGELIIGSSNIIPAKEDLVVKILNELPNW